MKKKIVFLTIILALILTYTTNFVERVPRLTNINTSAPSYGFPFISIEKNIGGFTGPMDIPQIGLIFNFAIYIVISFIISYLIFKRKTNNISKIS